MLEAAERFIGRLHVDEEKEDRSEHRAAWSLEVQMEQGGGGSRETAV